MTQKTCKLCDNLASHRCNSCGEYFCDEHRYPKLTMMLERFLRSNDIRIEKEWRKENAHPCPEYSEWLKKQEEKKLDRAWESLNKLKNITNRLYEKEPHKKEDSKPLDDLKNIPKVPRDKKHEYSEDVPTHIKSKNKPIKLFAIVLIICIVGWYLYSNPEFFNASNESASVTSPTKIQQVTFTSKDISYILNYQEEKIYFPSQYYGKINETSIGQPLNDFLQTGWKIQYQDLPEHSTTSQKITVKIATTQSIIVDTTTKTTPAPSWLSAISDFLSRFSIWRSLNCTDGTLYDSCSESQPYYCFNGTLVKNSTVCGCPYDYKVRGNDCEKIQRCNDKTIYDECSSQKPFYCLNGNLVGKASSCGCPVDEIVQGDNCISKFQVGPKEIQMPYVNGYITFTIYKGLNDYLASLSRYISYYDNPPTTKDFIMKKLDDVEQKRMLDPFVEEIKKITSIRDDQARIAIRLVQSIPYDYASFTTNNVTGKYPYEVLYTNTGVCSEKAYLLVYLLRGLGYSTAVLEFKTENHDAVGIKCPSEYNYKNTGYCFVEATQLTAIGDSYGNYVGVGQLTSTPEVIVISDGYALNSIW